MISTILASAALAATPAHGQCVKTYTVHMATRAITAEYMGTRTVTQRDRRHVARFVACQRNPMAVRYLRPFERRKQAAWWARLHPPVARPESWLASCIIQRESGGNPQAVNGQYTGLAQWSPSSWAGGGGTRYSSTPLGASYSEQVTVLNDMLPSQASQWTPYDGC